VEEIPQGIFLKRLACGWICGITVHSNHDPVPSIGDSYDARGSIIVCLDLPYWLLEHG
jgi:hypothetical protein